MCGFIAGTKTTLKEVGIASLLKQQVHRGTDGYGAVALFENGGSMGYKSMDSKKMIEWVHNLDDNPYVFIHHRATSVGATKIELAHPLSYNKTLLMQNGTNRSPYEMIAEAESDSKALCMLADSMEPDDFAVYILTAVGVVIFRKDKKFYLHKDGTRPLNEHSTGLLCSEPLGVGMWRKVEEGFYDLDFRKSKLHGLKYKEFVEVEDVGGTKWCSTCKSRHLIARGGSVCNVCIVNGTPQKKEYPYSNSSYGSVYDDGYDDDDDYYIELFKQQKARRESAKKAGISGTGKVKHAILYALVSEESPKNKQLKKKLGTPVNVDGDFYLVSGGSQEEEAMFYVLEEQRDPEQCKPFKGGWIPVSMEPPIGLTPFDFTPYWSDEARCFDLYKNTYYLEASCLTADDMSILVYDKYLESYVIPMEYTYDPESYAKGTRIC